MLVIAYLLFIIYLLVLLANIQLSFLLIELDKIETLCSTIIITKVNDL